MGDELGFFCSILIIWGVNASFGEVVNRLPNWLIA